MNKSTIADLVNKKLEGTECFLVDVKYSPSRIAVFIDKPTGITIGECTEVSRFLFSELDGKDILETHELEVGSPGMSEPLKVYQQYLRRISQKLTVIDNLGVVHSGVLKAADSNGFALSTSKIIKEGKKKVEYKEELNLKYTEIKEAKLDF